MLAPLELHKCMKAMSFFSLGDVAWARTGKGVMSFYIVLVVLRGCQVNPK